MKRAIHIMKYITFALIHCIFIATCIAIVDNIPPAMVVRYLIAVTIFWCMFFIVSTTNHYTGVTQ